MNVDSKLPTKMSSAFATEAVRKGNPKDGTGYVHTVQSGETLSSISRRFFGSTDMVASLADAAGLKSPSDVLRVGTQVSIPMTTNYTVKPGDTLSKIARQVDPRGNSTPAETASLVKALAKMNGLENPNDIRVGQLLAVPHV